PPLIEACTGLGDLEAVGPLLDRLVKLRSGPAVKARKAAVYRERGWREDAAAQIADAAAGADDPAERAAYVTRAGELAWERGERAGRLGAGGRAARAGQGRALPALGRTAEPVSAYRVALAQHPPPRYPLERGHLYEALGRERDAGGQ